MISLTVRLVKLRTTSDRAICRFISAPFGARDNSSKFLDDYLTRGIYKKDPFQELDTEGVGSLMRIAIERGRKAKKRLTIGICGEHGGDPASVRFCHSLGLDYVSCSPFRLPIARLAAAQAALEKRKSKREF